MIARSQHSQLVRVLAAALILAGAAMVTGCSASHSLIDNLPASVGGLPQGTPERPATPTQYPAVHDMPPARRDAPLSEAEKKRLKDELIKSRERAARQATSKESSTNTSGQDRNP
jgi:hypothetical protein